MFQRRHLRLEANAAGFAIPAPQHGLGWRRFRQPSLRPLGTSPGREGLPFQNLYARPSITSAAPWARPSSGCAGTATSPFAEWAALARAPPFSRKARNSSAVRWRHWPIGRSPMRIGPIAVRTSFSTLLANGFDHAPDLPVAPLRNRQLEEACTWRHPAAAALRPAAVGPSLNSTPRRSCSICSSLRSVEALSWYVFGTLWSGLVIRSAKSGVVGHQQKAARIQVQPAHRRQPGSRRCRQVIYRWAPFRVPPGGQVALRLIQ